MQFNSSEYKAFLYDGHGHSTASDGLHTPEQIIDLALKKELQIIGLSDHNIITNIPRFLAHADKINAHTKKILPIPSVEISTSKGDLLVTIPDRDKAENFLTHFKKPTKRPNPLEIIEEYIDTYNAIIIFPHPEITYVNGFKLNTIEEILEKTSKKYHKNLGLEVYNWMSQAFFWERAKKEKGLHNYNKVLGLSPFSFTDYHAAFHIGNGSTTVYMKELSSSEFIHAVQERRTAPFRMSNRGFGEYMEIIKATLIAESLSRLRKKQFHVPRTRS